MTDFCFCTYDLCPVTNLFYFYQKRLRFRLQTNVSFSVNDVIRIAYSESPCAKTAISLKEINYRNTASSTSVVFFQKQKSVGRDTKDSIVNTIAFSIQLFICMFETIRTSECGKVEQKIKRWKNELFYYMLANVYVICQMGK